MRQEIIITFNQFLNISMNIKCVSILFLLYFYSISIGYSQPKSSFQIIEKGSIKDVPGFEADLNKADFDKYRLRDKRRILEFEDGAKVYPNKFALSSTGHVIERVPVITK